MLFKILIKYLNEFFLFIALRNQPIQTNIMIPNSSTQSSESLINTSQSVIPNFFNNPLNSQLPHKQAALESKQLALINDLTPVKQLIKFQNNLAGTSNLANNETKEYSFIQTDDNFDSSRKKRGRPKKDR